MKEKDDDKDRVQALIRDRNLSLWRHKLYTTDSFDDP